jgi:hypothetical protein
MTSGSTRLLPSLAAGLLLACSGGPNGGTDGDGGDGSGDVPTFEVTPPAPPVLTPCPEGWAELPPEEPGGVTTCEPWPDGDPVTPPQMTPCPAGWTEVTDPVTATVTCDPWPEAGPAVLTPCPDGWRELADAETGTVTCDPWPEGGPHTCDVDEAHFPGEPECVVVGDTCPAGNWTDGLPATAVLYVRAGAGAGGAGTMASPFGSVAEAMAAATSGTIVALSKGTFDEAVVIPQDVTVWGACAAETLLAASAPSETEATVTVTAAGTSLRNVRVAGERLGVAVGAGGALAMDGVAVGGAMGVGISVTVGGTVTANEVIVRDTRYLATDRSRGWGIQIAGGSQFEGARVAVERNRGVGLFADEAGTTVVLSDVAVRGTEAQESDGFFGRGVNVDDGAFMELTRVSLDGNREAGALAGAVGTTLRLLDGVIRDTRSVEASGESGLGVVSTEGARVELTRALVANNRHVGVAAFDPGTTATLTDVVIRDTQPDDTGAFGRGISVGTGARLEGVRVVAERNREAGAAAEDAGSVLMLTDVVVRDTREQDASRWDGFGLSAATGARAEIQRGLFEGNRVVGISATDAGTTIDLTDVVVRDTQPGVDDDLVGRGLGVETGAVVTGRRVLLDHNREAGAAVLGTGSTWTATDLVVRDTQEQLADGVFGYGLSARDGGRLEIERAAIERNGQLGIRVMQAGSTGILTDVAVRDTVAKVADGSLGRGALIDGGGVAEIRRAVFERNREGGIVVTAGGSSLLLDDAIIRDTFASERDLLHGWGLTIQEGASADVARVLIVGSHAAGAAIVGDGTTATLVDLVVRDTEASPAAGNDFGHGLTVQEGALATVSRALVERNRDIGVFVTQPGTVLTLTDAVVRDTLAHAGTGFSGRGMHVQSGAQVDVTRLLVENNREAGITAGVTGTEVRLTDVLVLRTLERECATSTCIGFGAGVGVGSYGGAWIEMTRFLVTDSAACGIQLAHSTDADGSRFPEGGTMDLHDGEVSFNGVCGANVQTEGFDVDRLMGSVSYHDNNGMNLDMTELPVPGAEVTPSAP